MAFRSRVVCFMVWIGAFALGLTPAWAEPRALELAFVGCDESLSVDDARRIASIELESDADARAAMEEARIDVLCEGSTATLRAARADTTLERRMPLDTVDQNARARLVALGMAELAQDLSRVLASAPVQPPPPAPTPPIAAPMPPPKPGAHWMLALGPQLRYEARARIAAYGLRGIGERRVTRWLSITLAGEAARGERDIDGGALRWDQAGIELGARVFRTHGRVRIYAEAAAGGCLDTLEGRASEPGVRGARFDTVNGSARLGAGAELAFARHGVLALTLDARALMRKLEARNEGEKTTALGPWLFAATLGAGARW